MARSTSAIELNNFVAGIITEASPLNFPNNASLDEQNFVLRRDGTRRRRLGVDFEEGYTEVVTSVKAVDSQEVAIETYKWDNVGGDSKLTFIVIQVGNEIKVFDTNAAAISTGLVYTKVFSQAPTDLSFSYTNVDGMLVIAYGGSQVGVLKYNNGSFSYSEYGLLIRDLFGVEDIVGGVDLRSGGDITTRPASLTQEHTYNLRNQTWADPRKVIRDEATRDLILEFRNKVGRFPSNADVTTYSLYPDSNDEDDRLTDRFNWKDVAQNPVGTYEAPKGYFIINALNRGVSRLQQAIKLSERYSQLQYPITDLPKDTTPGGPTIAVEYAGRVFYGGFSGEVVDGDKHSPNLSSYILFSKLVEDPTDITACYQEGDPTSKEEPDLLDTDGGFIRIDGAYGIQRMINVSNALLILASNGVWMLQGGSDYGFKATNYLVSKISNYGCISPGTAVQVDKNVMFWSGDGIYVVSQNQFGDYVADNITQSTIQTLYDGIDNVDKLYTKASYDLYERKVYWTYRNRINGVGSVKQLVFDTLLGAFYPFDFKQVGGLKYPMLMSGLNVPPYRLGEQDSTVTVDGVDVEVDGELVTTTSTIEQSVNNETIYLTLTGTSPTIKYTFSLLRDTQFKDWRGVDGVGVDANAYLLTGWLSGGDNQRDKQVPYITFHFNKTEDGFTKGIDGDWYVQNPSGCLVSSQWDWANHPNSGKWSKKFQAYRFRRHYIPSSLGDGFDNGFSTVTTKNKLRGNGKVLSLLIETEPNKDCFLLGWSMVMSANNNV